MIPLSTKPHARPLPFGGTTPFHGQFSLTWLPPLLMVLFLGYLSGRNFLLFHTLAELFSIAVGVLAAVVAWHTYPFSRNHLLMFLGAGYFWIGMLDLIHTLSFKGMGIYPFDEANPATQFWIAARYFEALLLLAAPSLLHRPVDRRGLFLGFAALSMALYWLILGGHFPDAYLEGAGLTPFKVWSEYLIIALLFAALARMWHHREHLGTTQLRLISAAILFTVIAEVTFTTYIGVYDQAVTLGHLAKLFSFWLLFVAIVRLTLTEPFRAMAHDATSYDAVPDPTLVVDHEGRLSSLNRAARALHERPLNEQIGRHVHELFHPATMSRHDCPVCRAIDRGEALRGEPLHFADEGRWYDVSLSPITAPDGVAGMVHVMRDITDTTVAQRALESSEARYRAIMAQAGDAVLLVDDLGRLVDVNRHAERLLGYSRAEFLTMTPFDCHPAQEHDRVRDGLNALLRGETLVLPFQARHKDGTLIPVEIAGSTVHVDERPYILGIFRDQRDQQAAAERERELEARVARIERLSSAGEIATSLAHELNQPLAAVVNFAGGCVNRVKRGEQDPQVLLPALEQIVRQGRLAGDTIHRLRVFLRGDDVDLKALDATTLVEEAAGLLDGKLRRAGVRLEHRLEGLPPLLGDRLQLQQVLVNLILNAIDALEPMEPLEPDDRWVKVEGREMDDGRIELVVRDNGPGISERGAQRIFEPFHSTKEGALGMGLAVCRTIVEAHHGRIEARNDGGLAVHLQLPAAEEE